MAKDLVSRLRRLKHEDVELYGGALFLLVVAVGAAGYGLRALQVNRILNRAENQLQKGFSAVAADTLDPERHSLLSERGCRLMSAAYLKARTADRLEWVGEACIDAGHENPGTFLALAAARDLTGREEEAISILNQAAQKYKGDTSLVYSMAQIFRRKKMEDQALGAYFEAARRAPQDHQISFDALQYASSLKRWQEAKALADQLKGVETDNPEIKLVVARALLNGGDKTGAVALAGQAREMVAKKPEAASALAKEYSDVLDLK